jgi:hypothetical protein
LEELNRCPRNLKLSTILFGAHAQGCENERQDFHDVENNHIMKILSLFMEKGPRMIRCLATAETAPRVLYLFRDEPLRFQGANPDDDDESQVEHSGEEMEEKKGNVHMIGEEIRWAIGA